MPECVAIVEKTKLKCKNPAKFGKLCGVHENSRKKRESKATILAQEQESSSRMSASELRAKKTKAKLDKTIKERNDKKSKAYKKDLEKPSRRRSA